MTPGADRDDAGPFLRHRRFVEQLLIATSVLALILLLWWMRDLIVLLFGAMVTAVLRTVVAEPLSKATGLGRRAGLAMAIGTILLAGGLLAFFFGSQIQAQFGELSSRPLPTARRSLPIRARTAVPDPSAVSMAARSWPPPG